jgi:hypothetical protein
MSKTGVPVFIGIDRSIPVRRDIVPADARQSLVRLVAWGKRRI